MATEVKQRNNRVIVLVGVVIALVAFGLSLYVSHNGSSNNSSSGTTVPVAVAATDLLQGSQITSSSIAIKQYPAAQVPVGSSQDGNAFINQFVSVAVSQNTPLTASMMVADASSAKSTALTVAPLAVDKGFVAMAIPTNGGGPNPASADLASVGMWVQPGDHLDIIEDTGAGQIRYAFQDIPVLKVGNQSAAAGGAADVFVVEVPRAQAEELAYLISPKTDFPGITGPGPHIVTYVLRGTQDKGKGYLDDSTPSLPPTKDAPVTPQTFNSIFPSK